jgi:hypothetical protein
MTVFDRLEAQLLDAHPHRARRAPPRPTPRRIVAFAAAAAAVAAIAVAALSAGSSTSSPTPAAQPGDAVAPVVPGRTVVAVLDATRHVVPILNTARAIADHGWKLGIVTNYPGAPLDSSCVDFFPGHSLAATQLAAQLGIANVVPASDLLRKAVGQEAGVVVIVGRDGAR